MIATSKIKIYWSTLGTHARCRVTTRCVENGSMVVILIRHIIV